MSDIRDGENTPDTGPEQTDPATTQTPPADGVSAGLGGMPEPDAPSRRPRPKIVSLLAEFFTMSRTTAILLGTFVLVSVLYAAVKDDPVVGIRSPEPPQTSVVEPDPTSPMTSSPEVSPSITETTAPTSTDQEAPGAETTETSESARVDGRQTPTTVPGRPGATATQPPAQGQPQQGQPQQGQPQQQAPDGGTAAPPEVGQTVG